MFENFDEFIANSASLSSADFFEIYFFEKFFQEYHQSAGPRSAVGNVSDCRSRGHKFNPGPVLYLRGD